MFALLGIDPATLIVVLGVAIFFSWLHLRRDKLPFPPGPRGLPLINNLLDIPTSLEHLTYHKWGKKYGDVSHIQALGSHYIILNSEKAAVELLDQRSAIYSDRPYLPMLHDENLTTLNAIFGLKRYSRSWKIHRRLFTQHINPSTVAEKFTMRQLTTAYRLLTNILANPTPASVAGMFDYASATTILGITYGYDVQSGKDVLVELATEMVKRALESAMPKFLVNIFPFFKHFHWLPGVSFKRFAAEMRNTLEQMSNIGFNGAKQRIDAGDYTPSFVQNALAEHTESNDPESLHAIKDIALQMYGAGVDTTATSLYNLTLQLILHPQVQARAHAELDAVLGSPDNPSFRLPTFEDRSAFPYIDAVIKEGLRFAPSLPLGVPHATTAEDEYRGWRIPKGSVVISHAYGMNRDEQVYPRHDQFDPERFIEKPGKPAQADPAGTFGFGRRICPGRHLAESMMWIEVVCVLAAFTIEAPRDEKTGEAMDLRWAEKHVPGGTLRFQEYPCVFKPRSERVSKVIREMAIHTSAV